MPNKALELGKTPGSAEQSTDLDNGAATPVNAQATNPHHVRGEPNEKVALPRLALGLTTAKR